MLFVVMLNPTIVLAWWMTLVAACRTQASAVNKSKASLVGGSVEGNSVVLLVGVLSREVRGLDGYKGRVSARHRHGG
jgi:hypothetical protein